MRHKFDNSRLHFRIGKQINAIEAYFERVPAIVKGQRPEGITTFWHYSPYYTLCGKDYCLGTLRFMSQEDIKKEVILRTQQDDAGRLIIVIAGNIRGGAFDVIKAVGLNPRQRTLTKGQKNEIKRAVMAGLNKLAM